MREIQPRWQDAGYRADNDGRVDRSSGVVAEQQTATLGDTSAVWSGSRSVRTAGWWRRSAEGERSFGNVATGRDRATFEDSLGSVFSEDGKTLVVRHGRSSVRLWDTPAGRKIRKFDVGPNYAGPPTFNSDGKTLVLAIRERGAMVWDVATGTMVRSIDARRVGSHAWH